MDTPGISESEWQVMEVLWEASPRTASEVTKELKDKTGWADNTVRTLLTRLVDKGAVKIAGQDESPRRFAPAVKREACVKAESESFLERIFNGAAKPLLVHFTKNARLTPEEVKELKKLLDQSLDP
jgi:BlaI family transcriptional regulator, penicillinase repressor